MEDALSKPLLPQPGDAGAAHGCWEALGAQTLQPKPVSGQRHVSTNHREHPSFRDTLGLVSPQGAASDLTVWGTALLRASWGADGVSPP